MGWLGNSIGLKARKKIAQGKRSAALGHDSKKSSSPERAKETRLTILHGSIIKQNSETHITQATGVEQFSAFLDQSALIVSDFDEVPILEFLCLSRRGKACVTRMHKVIRTQRTTF